MKRLMSLILSLLMLIGVFTLNASAEQVGLSTETEDDYLTVVATDASPEFIEEVEDAGVNVTDTTVFQMTPVAMEGVSRSTASNENGTALVVTNQTGDMVTKDVFVPMEEDSVGFQLSPETRASGNFTYNATLVGSGKVTIRGTATFNQYDAFSGLGWIYFMARLLMVESQGRKLPVGRAMLGASSMRRCTGTGRRPLYFRSAT